MERKKISETVNFVGESVKVSGWVDTSRSHGKIIFIDLRDESGKIQVVFTPKEESAYCLSKEIGPEWVVEIEGKINERPESLINLNLITGKIELKAEKLTVLSPSETLPFEVDGDGLEINEELRLKYRYLDLRRDRLSLNIKKRHECLQFIRNFLTTKDFTEIETPILTKSTPEGARDFLVPSNFNRGNFYALPQSPQQYKQLLMVSGFEKYFQVARCFRDENSRANRQAEFTQIDMEMSFMSQEEILCLIEELMIEIIRKVFPNKKISSTPFPRMKYEDAIKNYQTDKPDIRKNRKDSDELAFLWVTDFPMFEWSENEKRWDAMHHPFTRPVEENIDELKKSPGKTKAFQYDLVLNGEEIGGGSLRSYRKETLEAIFEIMGHQKKDIEDKFGHLLKAFSFGVPPHGGLAIGFERFLSIVLNENNIREVIAFPKAGDSKDLMMQAPSEIKEDQLKELGIQLIKDESKKDKKN